MKKLMHATAANKPDIGLAAKLAVALLLKHAGAEQQESGGLRPLKKHGRGKVFTHR